MKSDQTILVTDQCLHEWHKLHYDSYIVFYTNAYCMLKLDSRFLCNAMGHPIWP